MRAIPLWLWLVMGAIVFVGVGLIAFRMISDGQDEIRANTFEGCIQRGLDGDLSYFEARNRCEHLNRKR